MKVIDVLNMWANGEDIKVIDKEGYFVSIRKLINNLNSEVELNEVYSKENKLINPIEVFTDNNGYSYYLYNKYGTKCSLSTHDKVITDKINEIIDKVNKL